MQTVHVQKVIDVPVEQGFAAWTEAEHLSHWFTEQTEIEARIGGTYRNSDGDRGEFLVVRPNAHLRFTWENPTHSPGTLVDIEFRKVNDMQHIVHLAHSQLKSEADADGMETGWRWALTSLQSYLETGKAITYEEWEREATSQTIAT